MTNLRQQASENLHHHPPLLETIRKWETTHQHPLMLYMDSLTQHVTFHIQGQGEIILSPSLRDRFSPRVVTTKQGAAVPPTI